LLDLSPFEGICGISSAGGGSKLMDVRSFARVEPLVIATEVQVGLRQGDARYGGELSIDGKKHFDVLCHRGREWIDLKRRDPLRDRWLFRRNAQLLHFHRRRSLGYLNRFCSRRFD